MGCLEERRRRTVASQGYSGEEAHGLLGSLEGKGTTN